MARKVRLFTGSHRPVAERRQFADVARRNPPFECGRTQLSNVISRHCEERSDEAIHLFTRGTMDCFAELVIGRR
jgi:hypothetical protein